MDAEVTQEIAKLSLYDVAIELVELMDFRDNEDLTEEERKVVDEQIEKYVAAELAKVDNIRGYLRHCEVMAAAAKEEQERQRRRADLWERKRDRIKAFCVKALQNAGKTKVEGKTGVLRIQKNGGKLALEITDEIQIPTKYTPMTITYPLDSEALRKDLEAGLYVPGAKLGERGVHLRVE